MEDPMDLLRPAPKAPGDAKSEAVIDDAIEQARRKIQKGNGKPDGGEPAQSIPGVRKTNEP
jgi:hypothetical protein